MRRRKQTQGTLFPFVSVLICIIGTLTLLIIAVGVTNSFDAGQDLVRAGDPILDDIAQAIREQQAVDARQELWRDQVREAEERLSSIRSRADRLADSREVLDVAVARVSSLVQDLAQAQNIHDEAASELDTIEQSRRASNEGSTKVTIASGSKLKPIFVECREKECVVLANGRSIATDKIKNSAYVGELLASIKAHPSWCLFLLVRQGGVRSFDGLYYRAREEVPLGFHPVLTQLALDVTDWPKPQWLN